MATAFEINGPTKVSLKVSPIGGSYVELGRSDGEELISFDTQVLGKEIFSDEGGMVPQEVIHLGTRGMLTMQLIKWDRAILNDLWDAIPRTTLTAADDLHEGVVGRLWGTAITGIGFFGIQIASELTDVRVIRSFAKCYILGDDAIREANIGNEATALRLAFNVLPDTNGNLYVVTNTAAL